MAHAGKKVFIVYCHAEPQSYNHAMLDTAKTFFETNGADVKVSDLYAMNWDARSRRENFTEQKDSVFFKQQIEEIHASGVDGGQGFAEHIRTEIEKLEWCDLLIFQAPFWWFGLPGLLKSWVDQVFVSGRVYGAGKWFDAGSMRGKRAIWSTTTGGPAAFYRPNTRMGDIDQICFPINHGMFWFCGFSPLKQNVVYGPARASDEDRAAGLRAWTERLNGIWTEEPLQYPNMADFNPATGVLFSAE